MMADELMVKFNRTGRKWASNPDAKYAIPPAFRRCVVAAAARFHPHPQELTISRSGKEFTCTVEKEVDTQLEVYLSNTHARIARKQPRKDILHAQVLGGRPASGSISNPSDREGENTTNKQTTVATPPLPDLCPAVGGDEMWDMDR